MGWGGVEELGRWGLAPSLPPFFYSPDESEYLRGKLIFTNNQPQKEQRGVQ